MISAFLRSRSTLLTGSALMLALSVSAHGQKEEHWRNYKKLEPAVDITVTVEKETNGKPISNAAVIFRASKNGKKQGGLEIKTNPNGEAKLDLIEVGSHVTVQVIADGFATAAEEFDVPTEEKEVVIKMRKPQAQVSQYENNDGKTSQRPVGVQEPPAVSKPKKATPAPATPPATAPAAPATSSPQ